MSRASVILVVDDNPLVRDVVAATLERKYEIRGASTVQEALTSCAQETPSLVLLDVHLEGPNSGFEVCAKLQAQDSPPPVVFLTGDPSPELDARCAEAGALALLRKPFSPLELLRRIDTMLE